MPWRLILFIVIFAVFLAFITFNLENRSDIVFFPGILVARDVPVFLIIFITFVLGLITSLPFAFAALKKKDKDSSGKIKPIKKPAFRKPAKEDLKNTSPAGGPNDAL